MEALVLGMNEDVRRSPMFLCADLPGNVEAEARTRLSLFPDMVAAKKAYLECPVSLPFAPALVHAKTNAWDVRRQVAWIILLLENEAIDSRKEVTLDALLDALDGKQHRGQEKALFSLKQLQRTRKLHEHYLKRQNIPKSSMCREYICEAVTLAFSHLASNLCWAKSGVAHCVGEPFLTSVSSGHFIALGLRRIPWKGVNAALHLRLSDWTKEHIVQKLPVESACLSSDSTVQDFRLACYLALRQRGIDLISWNAQGGAHELEVAQGLSNFRSAEWGFVFPNGNRLAKQERQDPVSWLCELTSTVHASCSQFQRSAVFVGDACLSPGVKHPEVYQHQIPKYQQALRDLGLTVISDFTGALAGDGVHWAPAAHAEVQLLLDQMVQAAVCAKISDASSVAAPAWWFYEQIDAGWYQAKCRVCDKFVTPAHLDSKDHKMHVTTAFTGAHCCFFLPGCTSATLLPSEVEVHGAIVSLKPQKIKAVNNPINDLDSLSNPPVVVTSGGSSGRQLQPNTQSCSSTLSANDLPAKSVANSEPSRVPWQLASDSTVTQQAPSLESGFSGRNDFSEQFLSNSVALTNFEDSPARQLQPNTLNCSSNLGANDLPARSPTKSEPSRAPWQLVSDSTATQPVPSLESGFNGHNDFGEQQKPAAKKVRTIEPPIDDTAVDMEIEEDQCKNMDEPETTTQIPRPPNMDEATARIFDAWASRADHVDEISLNQFIDWKWDNENRFGDVHVDLKWDVVNDFFRRKSLRTRTSGSNSLSIPERIAQGGNAFQLKHLQAFDPEEGDNQGLFFTLLLAELPLHRVKRNCNGNLPKSTDPGEFHRRFAKRYKEWLGPRPTLARWQEVTEDFLTRWCPPGKKNGFKWLDPAAPQENWTLDDKEIERIAFKTTFQYAVASMHYPVFLAEAR